MSGLAALLAGHNAPDVYQWHSAAHVPVIEHACERAGWKLLYLDGWTVEDKEAFLKATAAATSYGDDLGENMEALSDCLAQVSAGDNEGVVLLWDGWSPFARHDEEAFRVALSALGHRAHADRGCKFAAILRGDGPPLDLPELPVKH
jgi:Barstar (barnase inhibitor)